jgi:hypothetical protein
MPTRGWKPLPLKKKPITNNKLLILLLPLPFAEGNNRVIRVTRVKLPLGFARAFHSSFDVGRSMFDVHLFALLCAHPMPAGH